MKRWEERCADRRPRIRIHAGGASGNDYTLCGCALEGENGDTEMDEVTRGRINCPDCIGIIRHCKTIPARLLATGH